MDELDLLAHSTYDVALIAKNKELFNMLFNKIANTYKLFSIRDWSESNIRRVSFAPTSSRITNVFIQIKPNGEFEIGFRGPLGAFKDTTKYEYYEYSMDKSLTIKGITHENYLEHIPSIVKAIELCDYSFK